MQKLKRNVTGLIAILLALPLIMAVAWGMGKRPSENKVAQQEAKQQKQAVISRKARLAGMEGFSRKREDLLEKGMSSWESSLYDEYVVLMKGYGSDKKVLYYKDDEKKVKVAPDSSFAVVVEGRYYLLTEEGREDNSNIGVYFINGTIYAVDTLDKVLWAKNYDCGDEPMWGQGIEIVQLCNRHLVIEIPDRSKIEDEYNYTYILLDKYGREKRRFDSNNYTDLSQYMGKYLVLNYYDNENKGYKKLIYNLFDNDSVVVYGAVVNTREDNDMIIIRSTYFDDKGKKLVPDRNDKYDAIKGKIIDMRPKK